MLYCISCHKWANNRNHKCNINSLISVTKNMLPVALKVDSIGLQVASAFCLTDTHNHNLVEAGVYFKCLYPEVLLQDLPSGWYWTDYITIDKQEPLHNSILLLTNRVYKNSHLRYSSRFTFSILIK